MTTTITRCTPSDGEHLAGLIARAFTGNPVTDWLARDMGAETDRLRLFTDYFRILVDHALTSGEVEAVPDGSGAALWLPPDAGPPPDYDERMTEVTGVHRERFRVLDDAMHTAHPADDVHQHLAFLAVEPGLQSRGHGSALLEHHHRMLDERGVDAYLEASAPRNRALYERSGYASTGATIDLPDGPPMWPMRKPARGGRA